MYGIYLNSCLVWVAFLKSKVGRSFYGNIISLVNSHNFPKNESKSKCTSCPSTDELAHLKTAKTRQFYFSSKKKKKQFINNMT